MAKKILRNYFIDSPIFEYLWTALYVLQRIEGGSKLGGDLWSDIPSVTWVKEIMSEEEDLISSRS